MCALLHQIYAKRPALIKHALPAFGNEGEKIQGLFSDLWAILQASLTDPAAGNTICVLDALDECEESGRILLINAFKRFHSKFDWDSTNGCVKFLVTSRPYQVIERKFRTLENTLPQIRLAGEDEMDSIKKEIDLVIKDKVRGLRNDLELDSRVAEDLEFKLLGMDHRTYLWLKLVLFELENNFSASTSKKLLAFIKVIPKSVEDAYEAILNRSTDKQLARKILNIVVAARRPLTLSEMDIALAIGDHTRSEAELDLEGDKSLRSHIRNLCGLFLNITDSKIYLIHQTAREFLMVKDHSPGEPGALSTPRGWKHSLNVFKSNGLLAEVCLRYLCFEELNRCPLEISEPGIDKSDRYRGAMIDNRDIDIYLRNYSFLDYSSGHWTSHAQEATIQDGSPLLQTMTLVCDTSSNRFLLWYSLERKAYDDLPKPSCLTSVSIAALYGLVPLLCLLLTQGGDVNAKADGGWTALHFAAENGPAEAVGVLLELGADIFVETDDRWTPLYLAAKFGHEEVVMQLLDKGADVNIRCESGETPLLCASEHGHLSVVSLLLAHGGDIQAANHSGTTSLSSAAENGYPEVVKLLLDRGANIEAADNDGKTSLILAAQGNCLKVLKLLLNKGANIEAADDEGKTSIMAALWYGYLKAFKLLLDNGADIQAADESEATVLHYTIMIRSPQAV